MQLVLHAARQSPDVMLSNLTCTLHERSKESQLASSAFFSSINISFVCLFSGFLSTLFFFFFQLDIGFECKGFKLCRVI